MVKYKSQIHIQVLSIHECHEGRKENTEDCTSFPLLIDYTVVWTHEESTVQYNTVGYKTNVSYVNT